MSSNSTRHIEPLLGGASEYIKTGIVANDFVGSGADVAERSETGMAITPFIASGPDVSERSETGAGISAYTSLGAKLRELAGRTGVGVIGKQGTPSFPTEVLADTPSIFYEFEETAGTNANDSSPNNNDGTYQAAVVLNQSGLIGRAIDLPNSATGRVDTSFALSNAQAYTFEGITFRDTDSGNDYLFGGSGASAPFVALRQTHSTSSTAMFDFFTVGSWPYGSPMFGLMRWVHWALTYDPAVGANGTAELFINGISLGTKALSGQAFGATPGNLIVGATAAGANPTDGKYDAFAVYQSVLSAARIKAHAASVQRPITPQVMGQGTYAASTSGITPSMPASVNQGYGLVLILHTTGATGTPSGGTETWTEIVNVQVPSTLQRLQLFTARASQNNPTSPTIADVGAQAAMIHSIANILPSGQWWGTPATNTEATSDTSLSIPGLTTTQPNSIVLLAAAMDAPVSSQTNSQTSAYSSPDMPTAIELMDRASNVVGMAMLAYGEVITPATIQATSITLATAAQKAMASVEVFTDPNSVSGDINGFVASGPKLVSHTFLKQAIGISDNFIGSGADSFNPTETGIGISPRVASGPDVSERSESGAGISPFTVLGADVFSPTETGSAISPRVASGADVFNPSETGSGISPFTASGADVKTSSETGSGITPFTVLGSNANIFSETGLGIAPFVASGVRARDLAAKTGAGISAFTALGADVFIATESGTGIAVFSGSGAKVLVGQPIIYTKAGLAIAAFVAAGPKAMVYGESGLGLSFFTGSGADSFTSANAGSGIAPFTASGSGDLVSSKTGSGIVVLTGKGADVFTAAKVGLAVIPFIASGSKLVSIPGDLLPVLAYPLDALILPNITTIIEVSDITTVTTNQPIFSVTVADNDNTMVDYVAAIYNVSVGEGIYTVIVVEPKTDADVQMFGINY